MGRAPGFTFFKSSPGRNLSLWKTPAQLPLQGQIPSQGSWNAAHTAPLFCGDGTNPPMDLAQPCKLLFVAPCHLSIFTHTLPKRLLVAGRGARNFNNSTKSRGKCSKEGEKPQHMPHTGLVPRGSKLGSRKGWEQMAAQTVGIYLQFVLKLQSLIAE